MQRKLPIFYSALLLTGVNLLLRFAGTSFQVYLSGRNTCMEIVEKNESPDFWMSD